jgi:hypothetical protein
MRFSTNIDLRFTASAPAAGKSNIIIFLVPTRQADLSAASIGEIEKRIAGLSALENSPFDKAVYEEHLKEMYQPDKTRVLTIIKHGSEVKYFVITMKIFESPMGNDSYLSTVIVSFLGFNGKWPQIKGTIFSRPGADVLLVGPGLVEMNYLRAIYKSPEGGDMICPKR